MTGERRGTALASSAVPVTTEQTVLGEGVRWDARREELLRLDILRGRVYRDRVAEDGSLEPVAVHELPGTVGAVAPVADDSGWLLAVGRGFIHLRPDCTWRTLADVAPEGTRMNDAACDPQGRFWAGTMSEDDRAGRGALYRLDRDGGVEQILDGLTVSNGLGWSPDATTMYVIDSGPRTLHAFSFEPGTGALSDERVLLTLPPEEGSPDGMTVDAAGDLWVAVYGGGHVRRYSPHGILREIHTVPAEQTTCCAFGGAKLDALYVTTATEHWSDEDRRAHPEAGVVYRLMVDAVGRPAEPFRPRGRWWEVM